MTAVSSIIQNKLVPFRSGNKWGYSDMHGDIVIPCQYDEVCFFKSDPYLVAMGYNNEQDQLALVRNETSWGVINIKGDVILPVNYTSISLYISEGLALATSHEGVGIYSLENGSRTIPYYFDKVVPLSPYWLVSRNNQVGLVDNNGNEMVPAIYEDIITIESRSNGISRLGLKKDGLWALFSDKLKPLTSFVFDYIADYANDYIEVSLNEKIGFIGINGETTCEAKYSWVEPCDSMYAIACINNRVGVITYLGDILIPFEFSCISTIHNNLLLLEGSNGLHIFNFKDLSLTSFTWCNKLSSFTHGVAVYSVNGKSGLIDANLNIVTPPLYDKVCSITSGTADVFLKQKWGAIDLSGNIIVPFMVDDELYQLAKINSFWLPNTNDPNEILQDYFDNDEDDIITFSQNEKMGAINFQGKVVIPFQYDSINSSAFSKNVFPVEKDGKWGAFNTALNKEVIPPKYPYLTPFVKNFAVVKSSVYAHFGDSSYSGYKDYKDLTNAIGYVDLNGNEYWSSEPVA
jgi:hypothetical protein